MQLLARRPESAGCRAARSSRRWPRRTARPLVRLYLASSLQRVAVEKRWDAVAGLLSRAEDRNDHNQPLMAWYAAEPLGSLDPQRALTMAADSKLPRTFSFMVQRIAGLKTQEALKVLAERLARTTNADAAEGSGGGDQLDCGQRNRRQLPTSNSQLPREPLKNE